MVPMKKEICRIVNRHRHQHSNDDNDDVVDVAALKRCFVTEL